MGNQKYRMILDTHGQRGGSLFSNNIYSLNKEYGDSLVAKGRAVPYIEQNYIVHLASGKEITLSHSELSKYRRGKLKLPEGF